MSTSAFSSARNNIDPTLFSEAADLLLLLHSGESPETAALAIAEWRQRSEMHAHAWQCAEQVVQSFRQVPAELGRKTLANLHGTERRRFLRALGVVAVAGPLGLALWRTQPWAEWNADLRTATGEQRTIMLADGTRLVLNTATAVNVVFDARERHLHLVQGEIMVTTGHGDSRPFRVSSAEGSVSPLGTRYSVRQHKLETHVAVFDGVIEITTSGGQRQRLEAGEQSSFGSAAIGNVQSADQNAGLWEQGMLLARDMRLADWVEEMSRYRHGVLRCSPAVADLRISGAFPVTDSEAAIQMLAQTRPVAVRRLTRYWISLDAPA